ncbi:hypothetical protein [Streptomyces viridochromogenes]|uniref:hypothetical protein n=1 Tax=Streptomyces viridochromogenes TaxID=1938 RepID=UPI003CC7EA0F
MVGSEGGGPSGRSSPPQPTVVLSHLAALTRRIRLFIHRRPPTTQPPAAGPTTPPEPVPRCPR